MSIFFDNTFEAQRYPEEINCLESYIDTMPFSSFYANKIFTIDKKNTLNNNSYKHFKNMFMGVIYCASVQTLI